MLFNTYVDGDPREFMYYNGDIYINGTEITLTDEYINNNTYNGKKIWKHAYFKCKCNPNGLNAYMFVPIKLDWLSLHHMGLDPKAKDDYAPYFVIYAFSLDCAIEEITKPIKLTSEQTDAVMKAIVEPKSDFDSPVLIGLWIVYILVMMGSLIFKQFYLIWPIVSYIFYEIRKGILDG